MTKALLAAADLKAQLPAKSACIGIKPNLVTPTPADWGATTHPEVVAGIVEYLQERGYFHIVILEGAWIGDLTSEAYEVCGYRALTDKYDVTFFDTQTDTAHRRDCGGMDLAVCDKVKDIDFLINVPVLKGHCQTKITCALKNSKGLIPNSEKRRFHTIGLHKPIAHLGVGIRQDFIVVDHICGDLDFEEGGNPVVRNCIMVARDPVLVDACVCRLLGYKVSDVPYVALAGQLGVGCSDAAKAEVFELTGEGKPTLRRGVFGGGGQEAAPHRVLDVCYAVEDADSCSACYASLIPALDRLLKEGLLEKLDEKIAIGQGFREKTGGLGIGNCTGAFDVCIEGCPPEEDTVYQQLKMYILEKGR